MPLFARTALMRLRSWGVFLHVIHFRYFALALVKKSFVYPPRLRRRLFFLRFLAFDRTTRRRGAQAIGRILAGSAL